MQLNYLDTYYILRSRTRRDAELPEVMLISAKIQTGRVLSR